MCGINGIFRLNGDSKRVDEEELLLTRDRMTNRGPDGYGSWLSENGEIGFGHRRLSIIDLSNNGNQPMTSICGKYTIVFNGEIYNYKQLKTDIEKKGIIFKSTSDTEVILNLFIVHQENCLKLLRGMFAFAIWNNEKHKLFIARDPFGIKPLYYSHSKDYFRFASQVKALEYSGKISNEIDPAGVVGFLLWGAVPEPLTIRKSIKALQSGNYLVVKHSGECKISKYFDLGAPIIPSLRELSTSNAIIDSIKAHLVADVPVGIFLSSGLDSSIITSIACQYLPEPPTTFTLRFNEYIGTRLDEGPLAARTAKELGTKHIERIITKNDFIPIWETMLGDMDQPSIDGFQIYIISKFAHEVGLKVALSGMGGDEFFGSYSSFKIIPNIIKYASIAKNFPLVSNFWPALVSNLFTNKPKLAHLLKYGGSAPGAYFLYRGLFMPSEILSIIPSDIAIEGLSAYNPIADSGKFIFESTDNENIWEIIQRMEISQYMQNHVLKVTDWASMSNSLEIRVPFIDRNLFSALANNKYQEAKLLGKAKLFKIVSPNLYKDLFSRPKTGFGIPVLNFISEKYQMNKKHLIPRTEGLNSRELALIVLKHFVDFKY